MHQALKKSPVHTVWINARFLGRPVTGVERVARELIQALIDDHLDSRGCWSDKEQTVQFRLIAPKSMCAENPWPELPLLRSGVFNGHAWEQFDLPRLTQGDTLLSLCNTGPVLKRKHIAFLHDAQPFAIPENFSLPFRLWYRLMYTLLAKSAQKVLVNSCFTAEELTRHVGLERKKIKLCYLGGDHVRRIDENACLKRFSIPDQPFVLAVSSNNPNKNFSSVVRALNILGDQAPPCVIVGQQSQGHFAESTIEESKVTHLGYVTDAELKALYRRALCLVFPSFYEGFGLPPLEAMTLSCPVIVAATSSLTEIGADAALYCDPHAPESLASAIMKLHGSEPTQSMLRARGIDRAASFTWQASADVLIAAIQGCINSCQLPLPKPFLP